MNRKLNILIWFWGRRGGGPRYTLELARVLAKRNELNVYLSVSRQSELYASFEDIPIAGDFNIDTYESFFQFGIQSLKLPLLRRNFGSFIQEKKIDVVFCTMDHIWNTFMTDLILNSGSTYLLTVHDAFRHPGEDQHWRRWLLRRDIMASDATIVLTHSVRLALLDNYGYPVERIFLSTHGHFGDVNSDVSPRFLSKDMPVRLLFFGRILKYKGLDILLEALPLLRRDFPNLELEIWGAGDIGPYKGSLANIGGIRVENRWIEEAEIPAIFASSDLVVLPYREASQSGVVPTAFAFGIPCIATPIPGLCEQVTDSVTGVIASGFSPAQFAEAIAKVLRDPAFYQRLSLGCITTASTSLNWEIIGQSVAGALHGSYSQGKRSKVGR